MLLIWYALLVFGSVTLGDHAPAGSSYLPPTAATNGYGAPDYYDDYEDQQPSYSEPQVCIKPFFGIKGIS